MFLTTHAAAGMLIGTVVQNPAAAFAASAFSHFLLDMIPHETSDDLILEYPAQYTQPAKKIKRRTIISAVDSFFVIVLIIIARTLSGTTPGQPLLFITMLCGIFGGLLPDGILILTFRLDTKLLRWYFNLHNNMHFVISRVDVPRYASIIYQFFLCVIFIAVSYIFVH